ncbi:MAG: hypothetical protein PVH18_10615 [Chloroflexota bacterium]|jgi:hypothetical protein
MNNFEDYASFLVRIWTVPEKEVASGGSWQAEVEMIQTGEQWRFSNLEALVAFLNKTFQPSSADE